MSKFVDVSASIEEQLRGLWKQKYQHSLMGRLNELVDNSLDSLREFMLYHGSHRCGIDICLSYMEHQGNPGYDLVVMDQGSGMGFEDLGRALKIGAPAKKTRLSESIGEHHRGMKQVIALRPYEIKTKTPSDKTYFVANEPLHRVHVHSVPASEGNFFMDYLGRKVEHGTQIKVWFPEHIVDSLLRSKKRGLHASKRSLKENMQQRLEYHYGRHSDVDIRVAVIDHVMAEKLTPQARVKTAPIRDQLVPPRPPADEEIVFHTMGRGGKKYKVHVSRMTLPSKEACVRQYPKKTKKFNSLYMAPVRRGRGVQLEKNGRIIQRVPLADFFSETMGDRPERNFSSCLYVIDLRGGGDVLPETTVTKESFLDTEAFHDLKLAVHKMSLAHVKMQPVENTDALTQTERQLTMSRYRSLLKGPIERNGGEIIGEYQPMTALQDPSAVFFEPDIFFIKKNYTRSGVAFHVVVEEHKKGRFTPGGTGQLTTAVQYAIDLVRNKRPSAVPHPEFVNWSQVTRIEAAVVSDGSAPPELELNLRARLNKIIQGTGLELDLRFETWIT